MALIDASGNAIVPPQAKMFPGFVQFGKDIRVYLDIDGTCRGDLEAALEVIAKMPPGPDLMSLWFLARAINQQLKRDIESNSYCEDGIFVALDPSVDFADTPD